MIKWTIAKKIGSLAAILIIFIIAILIYSIIVMTEIQSELKEIAEIDIPLSEVATEIEINQLEQHIIMEQLILLSKKTPKERLSKKSELKGKFLKFNEKLNQQIDIGITLTNKNYTTEAIKEFDKIHHFLMHLSKKHKQFDALLFSIISHPDFENYLNDKIIKKLELQDDKLDQSAIALVR